MLRDDRFDIIASGLLCDLGDVPVSLENIEMTVEYLKRATKEERELIADWVDEKAINCKKGGASIDAEIYNSLAEQLRNQK